MQSKANILSSSFSTTSVAVGFIQGFTPLDHPRDRCEKNPKPQIYWHPSVGSGFEAHKGVFPSTE